MRRLLAAAITLTLLAVGSACGGTAGGSGADTVVVYSADGLKDWYAKRFAEFTRKTGIAVNVVEEGSGGIVSRMEKERANPQADVLVTLPPFIQRAAQQNLLAEHRIPGADQVPAGARDPGDRYAAMINNYLVMVYNPDHAQPAPRTWDDLLDPRFKGKLQYSTPGQAGDGTAVLLQLQHVLGDQGALDYLKRLETNNVGPSSSTGKLQPKVAKGELHVANGDLQMNLALINNDKSNMRIFLPADNAGKRSTFAIPYHAGLAAQAPHSESGKKLLEFLFSTEVQRTAPESFGTPGRADIKAEGELATRISAELDGVDIWQPDWNTVLTRLDADLAAYGKAVGR
ncbi:2-aminoethylphosphonate ABC transporter substrate-binding protein [Crossiella cryophila]|uniref:2-aminoethylphosphonate transport system substrate-binding protein n=1 Tax=Crossiella cryophila TaxID=43355 RepID=A0A7W7FVI6_9PSEU|nr:2-aminoethylphosphonate ABC transporter substrate-binding protein [Crossiella cryophila]MBB4676899.1 2-aminoethylphosphonate transport system substrate-binding protein [Crossiella cryophila]